MSSDIVVITIHPTMFAVKGWSVSADKLKSEVASAPANTAAPKKSKKRKRQPENVTSSNVADLWEKVIEQKDPKSQPKTLQTPPKEKGEKGKKDKKRQKLNPDQVPPEKGVEENAAVDSAPAQPNEKPSKKDKKKAKKDKRNAKETEESASAKDGATDKQPPSKAVVPSVPPAPAPAKLTPLQASMREKLISARFRHLNETLYTRPSAEALSLFADSPEMFTEYHEGFRRQVEVWPENPVEGYLAEIRARARARYPSRDQHRGKKSHQPPTLEAPKGGPEVEPLPRNRTTNLCTIADLGCGDARLASELQADKSKLRLEILSFDLHSPSPLVTKADISNLPLANGSVDVAVFCLALMGTNWIDFIEEAYRILRWKGELWVAEIKSRFGQPGKGSKVVEHSVGHRRKPAAPAKKAGGDKGAAADETTLLVEVDGMEDTRQQTDVSAFVDVLNKRGFMLVGQDQGHGAESIDLNNKMFVKMRFVKAAPAVKGKCVRKEEGEERSRLGGKMPSMAKKLKFIDAAEGINEPAVLKPCVYKIR